MTHLTIAPTRGHDRAVKQKEFGERYIKSSTQSRVAPEGGAVSAADGGSFQPSLRWQ